MVVLEGSKATDLIGIRWRGREVIFLCMQPLYDLNLQLLEDAHVVGNWHVTARRANQADLATQLIAAEKLRFEAPDRLLLLHNPELVSITAPDAQPPPAYAAASSIGPIPEEVGNWQLQRDPLLSRPYLSLQFSAGETRALITRMRRSRDGGDCEMILYFQTGMEVELQCAAATAHTR